MATIVTYTDQRPPENLYPHHIISPPRASPCCFTAMEELGTPRSDGHWVSQYRRCRQCGFAVRVILRELPDLALVASLREMLERSFVRNIPD